MNNQKQLSEFREKNDFLGYEFLTWLFLFLVDNEKSIDDSTKIILGNRLTTCLYINKNQKMSISSNNLENSHEVFASIKNGHVIDSLSLQILNGQISINFNINAQDFSLTKIHIKNDFNKDALFDEDQKLNIFDQNREELFLRMANLDIIENITNNLFLEYLTERLDDKKSTLMISKMKDQVRDFLKVSVF